MIVIAVAFMLLAFAAGLFLLAKTQKEALGGLFKWGSYFIIAISFLGLIGIGVSGAMRCMHHGCGGGMGCCHSSMSCCHGGMMPGNCCNGDGGACTMHDKKACCDGMKGSCAKDGKMHDDDDAKKDSTTKK